METKLPFSTLFYSRLINKCNKNLILTRGIIINISQTKLTLIVAAASQLLIQLIANMTVVALPEISLNLDLSAEAIMWINLIYLMSFVAFSLPFAKIISQYGVKRCTKASLFLLLTSFSSPYFQIMT